MRGVSCAVASGVVALSALLILTPVVAGQTTAEPPERMPAQSTLPAAFAGMWDYNPTDSINVATGRPEQTPRSATQRGVAPAGGRGGGAPAATGARGAGTTGGGRSGQGLGVGPTPAMMREARDMSRDLLEVPEALTIALTDSTVSITDDIERRHVYPVDGSRNKYRLGASEFNARVRWTGTELRKEIEGAFGFKMSETYYLSADAQRLFVIIRLEIDGRSRQLQGVNRVYDRLSSEADTPTTDRAALQ